jgi:hypothetical protein
MSTNHPAAVSEQQVLEELRQLPAFRWPEVLAFVRTLRGRVTGTAAPPVPLLSPTGKPWTATELLQLPEEQRAAILREQARAAEAWYRNDPELTAFETYREDDLYEHPEPSAR